MTPSQICNRIFELVDTNQDGGFRQEASSDLSLRLYLAFFLSPPGQISLSEFMEGAQKDQWVMNLLKLDINATSWVVHKCEKLP